MSASTTALLVAGISGLLSIAAALGVELSRRRTGHKLADLKSANDERLEELKAELTSERELALEKLRSAHQKELEELKDSLSARREAATKAEAAQRLVDKYRDPLLRSA